MENNRIRSVHVQDFAQEMKGLLKGIDMSDVAVMDADAVNEANKFEDPSMVADNRKRNVNSLK